MMNRQILGYARVSSEEQAQHGISISAQRDILNGYAAMNQTTIEIFEDPGYSGKNMNRPAITRLMERCRAGGVSAVVVWKLDRLSRSLRDTLTLIEDLFQPRGITLVSVTESIDTSSPSGRMMLNLLASFAQLEREQDSDRVVMAHKHLARDCKYLGGHVPYGYAIDAEKNYQLDPATAPMIRHAFDLYRARAGYAAILEYLNAPDRLPLFRRKSPFTKAVLFSMLSNEIYSGVYVRRLGADPRHRVTSPETIRVPGGVPAILTPDEWHQVENIRSENKTAQALYTARTVYPLSGLVFCGVCGKRMPLNHGGKSRSGEPERYYTCRNHCVKPARLENAEKALFSALEYYNQHETQLRRACALANDYSAGADLDNSAQAAKLEKEIQQNNRKTARLIQFIEEHGASAPASMLQELTALEQRNDSIRKQIQNLSKPRARYDADKTVQAVRAVLANKKTPPEQLQQLIHAAVFRVRVHPDSYEIILAWHACGGDEPPRYVCHAVPRPVR